uniref:Uncharacterized protein n=1 Tax=Anguilla anguilla TaxID=7936 RepID=A0A0E9UWT7_ANGAN
MLNGFGSSISGQWFLLLCMPSFLFPYVFHFPFIFRSVLRK